MQSPETDISYDARPPVTLLIGGDRGEDSRLADMLVTRGVRLIGRQAIEIAETAASGPVPGGIVVADLSSARGAGGGRMLDRVRAAMRDADGLVILPVAMIDAAMAIVERPGLVLLPDPLDDELADAIDLLLGARTRIVAEEGAGACGQRLAQLGEEVARIARRIVELAEQDRRGRRPADGSDTDADLALLPHLRRMIRQRRLREQFFDRALFADPAWDMLLDLAAARLESRRVAVSSLCIAAAVPPTTALRWIAAMSEQGLLVRTPDTRDGRRVFVELSETATAAMTRYVALAAAEEPTSRRVFGE